MIDSQKVTTIPTSIKLAWGSGALGVAILMNVVAGFALFYMVSVLKINPAIAGLIVSITKIFDLFTDPIVGSWSDQFKSKRGRRRPFLVYGALLSAISFIAIFTTPVFDNPNLSAAYIFVAMIIYTLGYTLFNVPYLSMPAEMTDDYHERTSIHGYRVVFVSVAGFIGAFKFIILEAFGETSWFSFAIIGVAGGIIIFGSMMTTYFGTGAARFTVAETERPKILNEVRIVFANKHFVRLIAVKAVQLFGVAATIASMMFFITHTLQLGAGVLLYYGLLISIVSIIVTPLLVKLSKIIGKRETYIVAAVFYILNVSSWIFAEPGEPLWALLLRGGLIGIASVGNVVMAMSMLTDIINLDAKKSGVRREGIYTSFYSFVEKFTFACGPLIVGLALAFAGFDANLPSEQLQTEPIRQSLLLGMSYIPAAMGILSIILLAGYKLKAEDVSDTQDDSEALVSK